MEFLNKVELRGIVGSIRTQEYSGSVMARIRLATNYEYKGGDGSVVVDTSWHNVIAWEGRNIHDLDMIDKGAKLYVEGRLRYQKYVGTDGVERISTDIIANKVEIIHEK